MGTRHGSSENPNKKYWKTWYLSAIKRPREKNIYTYKPINK